MDLYTIITTVAIPFVIGLLKKFKLSSKWAPLAALVIAGIFVTIGQLLGISLDTTSIVDAILKALATAGIAVLGYDQVKKLTETK